MHQPSDSALTAARSPLQCVGCGACCATYRVSFYWAEAQDMPPDRIEQLTPVMACMAGTNQPAPRCVVLQGQVGVDAHCGLYAARRSPCREVQPGDERCLKARAHHGLP